MVLAVFTAQSTGPDVPRTLTIHLYDHPVRQVVSRHNTWVCPGLEKLSNKYKFPVVGCTSRIDGISSSPYSSTG